MATSLWLAAAVLALSGVAGAQQAAAGQSLTQSVPVDGVNRGYRVHLPSGYAAGRHYPLIVVFRGRYLTAERLEETSGLDDLADRQGFIVAYAEPVNGIWNLGIPAPQAARPAQRYRRRGFGYPGRRGYPGGGYPGGGYPGGGYPGGGYPGGGGSPGGGYPGGGYPGNPGGGYPGGEPPGAGGQQPRARLHEPGKDLAFFDALVTRLKQVYAADPARVYLVGMGEGAMMSFRVACSRAQNIAGMAMIGGALPRDLAEECVPTRPVSLLMINGTKDPIVPYKGGKSVSRYQMLAVEKTAETWAKMDNCGKSRKAKEKGQGGGKPLAVESWEGCAQGSRVRLITIPGAGGAWPGGGYQPDARFGKTSQAIDGSSTIWGFLKSVPAPAGNEP